MTIFFYFKIVWDEEKKCYVNLAEPDQPETKIKPPPMGIPNSTGPVVPAVVPIMNNNDGPIQQQQQPPANNIYSLKNKQGRTNYYAKLDVMANTKKADNPDIKPLLSTVAPPAQLPSNFFLPQPAATNECKKKKIFFCKGGPLQQKKKIL